MRRLITTTLLIFIITGINGQLLFNPQGGGPPFGHQPLLMPGQKPAPVNSPFADSYEKSRKKPSSSDGFDDLIRLLQQPKSIWGDDDGDGDDNDNNADSTFPLFGSSSRNNNNNNNRFPFGNGNPFGEGLLGDRRKLGEPTSGGKKLPNNPFSSFPLFLDDILKPVLDLSPPPQKPVNGKSGPPPPRRGAPGRKTVLRPQLTVAQLITKHNLTWKDFIPHVPRITIPGIQLTVNLDSLPAPPSTDPKKAAVMGETIAKLNDALKSIFPPAFSPANITKVELNINEQGIRPVIIDAQLPGWSPANKTTTDDQNQSKSFLDRLSAIFNKKENEHKEVKKDDKVMNDEDKQKSSNNALVRFFYFISRRSSSSPLENAPKNASKPAIEGKTTAESAYSTSNDSNGAAAFNLIPIWVLSAVFLAFFNLY